MFVCLPYTTTFGSTVGSAEHLRVCVTVRRICKEWQVFEVAFFYFFTLPAYPLFELCSSNKGASRRRSARLQRGHFPLFEQLAIWELHHQLLERRRERKHVAGGGHRGGGGGRRAAAPDGRRHLRDQLHDPGRAYASTGIGEFIVVQHGNSCFLLLFNQCVFPPLSWFLKSFPCTCTFAHPYGILLFPSQ